MLSEESSLLRWTHAMYDMLSSVCIRSTRFRPHPLTRGGVRSETLTWLCDTGGARAAAVETVPKTQCINQGVQGELHKPTHAPTRSMGARTIKQPQH